MLRRLRRPAAALVPLLLVLPLAASCGSDGGKSGSSGKGSGLPEVSLSGDVGKSITPKWHKKVAQPKSTKVTTLVKGSGEKISKGDTVSTYLWIADGTTKKVAYSDYQNGKAEPIPNNGQVSPVFDKLFDGATYGSRVAAVTNATELLGSSSSGAQLGIGEKDSIVLVADFVKQASVSPKPSDSKVHDVPSSKLPAVVAKAGKPTSLDFDGVAKPSLTTPVQRAVLKKGHGAKVKASSTITFNYLGETYRAAKPFDESFSRGSSSQPMSNFVPGWQIGLVGVKAGSRVLLQIPPAYGYGAEGSGASIPGNATLWFVIDVIKVK